MGRHREVEGETRDVHSSIPIGDYNIVSESLGRDSISEYIRNKFKSDAQELEKRKEAKKIISCPYSNTAIGSVLSNNTNPVNDTPELDESRLVDDFDWIERIIKPLEKSGNVKVLDFIQRRSKHLFELVSNILNPKVRFSQIEIKNTYANKRLEDLRKARTKAAKAYRKQHEESTESNNEPETSEVVEEEVVGDEEEVVNE